MANTHQYQLDEFKKGDGLEQFNSFVQAVQYALNDLSTRIDGTNTKSAQLRYNVPIAEGVTPGTLVYWRIPENGDSVAAFAPALAKLRAIPGDQGESIEAPEARVEGMIIATDSGNTSGTLLMGGYWESQSCADACLGSAALSGTYYLSTVNAGMATMDPGSGLRQPVLSYYGGGKFSLALFYMAHDNHFHTRHALNGDYWVNADALAASSGVTAPPTAVFGYDASQDADMVKLGELAVGTTAIFENGVLMDSASNSGYLVSGGQLWYCGGTSPATKDVVLFNHFPFAYGSSVVRSIESESASLKVTNKNGLYVLKAADYISGGTSNSALAVSAISGNTVSFTPVVSGVRGGLGIDAETLPSGTVVLGTSDQQKSLLDAYSITYNGAASQNDGLFSYVSFPKGRNSSVTVSLPVRGLDGSVRYKCSLWALSTGGAHTMNVKMYFTEDPEVGGTSSLPTQEAPATMTSISLPGGTTSVSLNETAQSMTIAKSGLAVAVLSTAEVPSTDVRLLRLGFRLVPETAVEEEDTSQQIPETTKAITMTGRAGSTLFKYQAVKVNSEGALMPCKASSTSDSGECVGIALDAASKDDDVEYMLLGIVQDTNFNASLSFTPTPGAPVYIGADGKLSVNKPTTEGGYAFSQRVGTALTAQVIQVNIGTSVLL